MKAVLEQLKERGILKSPSIIRAFEAVDRAGFVKPEFITDAGLNEPLPIGFGQTISQPLTVAFMLELLQPQPGQKVLDVGSGSAWTTALLAEIVGLNGKVYGIERIPQLKSFGEANLKRAGYSNIELVAGDGARGLSEFAPFDRIQVAAAAGEVPPALLEQLAVGGRLVIPLGEYVQDVTLIEKQARGDYREQRFPGFQFVPLVTE
ncbi:MAG: protein-L-isoaspartate(D-aspartate) O-methyltransferase [Candidatus Kerfeldbacteria bacterium]|nr:protein-L-isoaspartate(D-aspartate) O-methyltransferase [Candidatus Kerfeldbacteria bacterium]